MALAAASGGMERPPDGVRAAEATRETNDSRAAARRATSSAEGGGAGEPSAGGGGAGLELSRSAVEEMSETAASLEPPLSAAWMEPCTEPSSALAFSAAGHATVTATSTGACVRTPAALRAKSRSTTTLSNSGLPPGRPATRIVEPGWNGCRRTTSWVPFTWHSSWNDSGPSSSSQPEVVATKAVESADPDSGDTDSVPSGAPAPPAAEVPVGGPATSRNTSAEAAPAALVAVRRNPYDSLGWSAQGRRTRLEALGAVPVTSGLERSSGGPLICDQRLAAEAGDTVPMSTALSDGLSFCPAGRPLTETVGTGSVEPGVACATSTHAEATAADRPGPLETATEKR